MEVKERIAYVRGLIEGAESFQPDPTSRAVWENLLIVCDELAENVAELETAQFELEEYVETIDTDLYDLEEEVYGEGYEHGDELELDEDETSDEDETEEKFVRTECPRCGEEVYFEEAFLYDEDVEISCPECGEVLYRGSNNGHTIFDDDEETLAPLTDHPN